MQTVKGKLFEEQIDQGNSRDRPVFQSKLPPDRIVFNLRQCLILFDLQDKSTFVVSE